MTAAAALLTTSLVAQAADLPQKAYAPPPVAMAMVYDWTGFYIGGNGGYGSNRACWGSFGGGLILMVATANRAAWSVARAAIGGRLAPSCSA
jgi:outer membrane immunogenic protein